MAAGAAAEVRISHALIGMKDREREGCFLFFSKNKNSNSQRKGPSCNQLQNPFLVEDCKKFLKARLVTTFLGILVQKYQGILRFGVW